MPKLDQISQYINIIEDNQENIIKILSSIATHESIEDEIARSLRVLRNAELEYKRENPPNLKEIAVYHSSNVILYSYTLFGLIPSLYTERISLRPSSQTEEQTKQIHALFKSVSGHPVDFCPLGQRAFARYSQNAKVVIFTGRFDNAEIVASFYPHALFLFFGSGTNPFVFGEDYHSIKEAISISIKSRLFNSGQDCLCPNIFFISKKQVDEYVYRLLENVKSLEFSLNTASARDYGPIFYQGVIEDVAIYEKRNEEFLAHKGYIDPALCHLDPLVFVSSLSRPAEIFEYFAPVFNIIAYDSYDQLLEWLLQPDNTKRAMGIALFKAPELVKSLKNHYLVAENMTLFELEDGNKPFGGYGIQASFSQYKGQIYPRPLLVSREVALHLGQREFLIAS